MLDGVTQILPMIGQPYDPTRSSWPQGAEWRLSPRGVELLVCLPCPDEHEVRSFHGGGGPARFAVVESPNVLVLCWRLGGQLWSDQPWQAVRQAALYPDYPVGLPEGGGHLVVCLSLVDSVRGVLRARGVLTWPPAFVADLRGALTRHLAGPQDDEAAGRELDELYSRWNTSSKLVRERATITCKAGPR